MTFPYLKKNNSIRNDKVTEGMNDKIDSFLYLGQCYNIYGYSCNHHFLPHHPYLGDTQGQERY